jgi:alkylation response protein AidB-like acyl-CoA dehydrogenase
MLDIHVVHRLTFDAVRVPASARLGEESAGWTIIRDALSNERIGAPRYARAGQVLEKLVADARSRGDFAQPRLRELATLAWADCEAARILTYRVIQDRANGQSAGPEAYIARAAIVKAERAVAAFATEMVGEDSLVTGSLADGEFRTAMIAGHGGGSYEMQLNLIARLWLNLPKGS